MEKVRSAQGLASEIGNREKIERSSKQASSNHGRRHRKTVQGHDISCPNVKLRNLGKNSLFDFQGLPEKTAGV